MASAYSLLHNYQQELYSPNLELINTALQFKQQSLNANREKLQTMYDQYSFLNVAKAEDQEYLENRLQSVKTIMDQYSSLDLSSSNLTGQLVNNMSQVVDDNVKNAVISTRIYQSEQAAWQKLKDENPEKYSEINHAYAGRASDYWLSDGKTGSVYKGGGGVIQYVDVQGKLSEKIPEIAESIKAEWVELSDGGGYFRNVVTKERVSRDQLETAMDGLLNEQDRRQMQINAWGTYDGMSDQELEASYTNYFAPKVDSLQEEIISLGRTIQSTKDPKVKEQRQELLNFYQDQLTAYEANSFSNVVENYGREAAYSTLYDNQFRSNYLNTYSYADRITKIDTYDNDVQQRNYEFKLAEFEYDKSQDEIDNRFKAEELRLKQEELAGGSAGSQTAAPGTPGYVAPLMSSEQAITYEETGSKIAERQSQDREIVDQAKSVFGVTSDADLRDLSKVFNEGFAGKEFIEFNGKKINVQENLPLLLEYQNKILTTSPVEKAATAQYNDALNKSLNTLREVAQGESPDWSSNNVPEFGFYFRKNEETGIMEKKDLGNNKSNVYQYLLSKKTLTEEEKFTLDVYHKTHLLMDPSLSDTQRNFILKELQTNQLSKVSNEDFKFFPTTVGAYTNLGSKSIGLVNSSGIGGRGQRVAQPTARQITRPAGERVEDTSFIRPGSSSVSADFYLSSITAKDAEYYDKNGREISLASPANILREGIKLYENTLETEFVSQELEPSLYAQVFSPETSGYDKLTTLIGLPAGSKIPVTLTRVWDGEAKKPTEEVKWTYTIKDVTFSSEDDVSKRLKVDQLRDNGIINFSEGNRLAYDASWGENSSVLDLGNNTYDRNIELANMKIYGGHLSELRAETQSLLDTSADLFGEQFYTEMSNHYKNFVNRSYEFKMESIDNIWQFSVYNNTGARLYNEPTDPNGVSAYSSEEVANIFSNNQLYVNQVMYNFLQEQFEKKQAEYALSWEYQQQRSMTQP